MTSTLRDPARRVRSRHHRTPATAIACVACRAALGLTTMLALVLWLAASPRQASAQGDAGIVQQSAVGGVRAGIAWGPPLVVAHGRRLDVLPDFGSEHDDPVGSLRFAQRIVAFDADSERAYVVTGEQSVSSNAHAVHLALSRMPSVVHSAPGGPPVDAVAMHGVHVWTANRNSITHLRWQPGGTPTATGDMRYDRMEQVVSMDAWGLYAVAQLVRVGSRPDRGRNLVLRVEPSGTAALVAELPGGTPVIGDGWVAVSDRGLAHVGALDSLSRADEPASRMLRLDGVGAVRGFELVNGDLWFLRQDRRQDGSAECCRLFVTSLPGGERRGEHWVEPGERILPEGGPAAMVVDERRVRLVRLEDGHLARVGTSALPGRAFGELVLAGGARS